MFGNDDYGNVNFGNDPNIGMVRWPRRAILILLFLSFRFQTTISKTMISKHSFAIASPFPKYYDNYVISFLSARAGCGTQPRPGRPAGTRGCGRDVPLDYII